MLTNFDVLEPAEKQLMIDSIAMVTILIAGADDKFDTKEIADSERVTKVRSYSSNERLQPFYQEVGANFSTRLREMTGGLPKRHAERSVILEKRLADLNQVFAKLDSEIAYLLYMDLLSFARHVAKSSGGILGYFSTSYAERKLVDLPMIKPIPEPDLS